MIWSCGPECRMQKVLQGARPGVLSASPSRRSYQCLLHIPRSFCLAGSSHWSSVTSELTVVCLARLPLGKGYSDGF